MQIQHLAYISLGANLSHLEAQPAQTLSDAVSMLVQKGLRLCAVSRFYKTPCMPVGAGPDYINAVIGVETTLAPHKLLMLLNEIEAQMGRARAQRWGARTLDLDILDIGGQIIPNEKTLRAWIDLPPKQQIKNTPDELLLPHPRIQDRAFVLVPFADIAPNWRHPVLHKTVAQLCANLPRSDLAQIVPI